MKSDAAPTPPVARVGDKLQTEMKIPHPRTVTMNLDTPLAAACANIILAEKPCVWKLVPREGAR